MHYIKDIKSFKESYLESNFSPLYHYTFHLSAILKDDILKRSTDSGKNILSISTMRNGSIIPTEIPNSSYRIVLNQETLRDDGYTMQSFDAVGNAFVRKGNQKIIPYDHYRISPALKVEPYEYHISAPIRAKVGGGGGGRVELASGKTLPFFGNEYEELILEDVKNLGNYIISIDINEHYMTDIRMTMFRFSDTSVNILEYIKKYPHIKVNEYYRKGNLYYTKPVDVKDLTRTTSKIST